LIKDPYRKISNDL